MKKQPWEITGEQMGFLYQMGRQIAKAKNVRVVSFSDIGTEHDCHRSPEDGCNRCGANR
jgi:hypothetical protein